MVQPLVSIVIPIYDTEKYVRRAVESICNQTYKNIEVILINDGSPDNSEKVCLDLVKEDARIKYFYQKNKGVSAARNLGIQKIMGEYVMFCDSDDEWKENLLEVLVKEMKENTCDMVRFGVESTALELFMPDELPEKLYSQKLLFLEYFSDNRIYKNMSSCCFGIFKREIIEKNVLFFDEDLKQGEDGKFVLQYLLSCNRIKFINQKLYIYHCFIPGRISATSRTLKELYNEYELCGLLFEVFYKRWKDALSEDEKSIAYSGFYDRVIGRLVRFAAYSSDSTRKKDFENLDMFLSRTYVKEAGNYYKRKRKTDSRIIPFLMKKKWTNCLWFVLRRKRKKYYQMYGRKKYVESIWKRDALIKI